MYGLIAGVSSALAFAPTFFNALDEGIYEAVGGQKQEWQKKEWQEIAEMVAYASLAVAGIGWGIPFFETDFAFGIAGTVGIGIGAGAFYYGSYLTDRIHDLTGIDFSATSLEGLVSLQPNISQSFQERILLANIVMKIGLVVIGGWGVMPALAFDLAALGRSLMQNRLRTTHTITPFTSSNENPPKLLGYGKWVAQDCSVHLHFPEFYSGKPGFAAVQLTGNLDCQMTDEELRSYIERQAQRVAEAVKESIKLVATDVYEGARYSHTSYELQASCDSIMIDSPVPGADPIPLEELLPEITCTIYVGPTAGTFYADARPPVVISRAAEVIVKPADHERVVA